MPWFDEHQQFDHQGKLIRDVDEQWLESLCENNNKRITFAAFGPGHTVPHVRDERNQITKASLEGDQPPHWGYLAEWSVRNLPDGTPAAGCVRYVKHKVELPTSRGVQVLPGRQAVDSFPYRSIEYSPAKHDSPYGALLRRPPERDVGATISYARGQETVTRGGSPLACRSTKRRARAAVQWGDRLYFSMEMNMADIPDPTKAPDAMAPDDDFRQKFESCMTDSYPHLGKMHDEAREKYEAPAPAAIAGPNNVAIPAAPEKKKPDDDMEKFSRETQAIIDRKYGDRLKVLEAENAAIRKSGDTKDAQSRVKDLAGEGYVFKPADLLQRFERVPMADRDAEMVFYRSHLPKADSAPAELIDLGEPERFERPGDKPNLDRIERAKQHMRAKGYSGEAGWEKALAETK